MDIVTKNLLKTFQAEESLLSDIEESVLFEHFANFCILAKEYSEEFSIDNIHTGDGGDMAIDGIAILVNGSLVSNIEEVDDLARSNKYIEAEFIFVQAKSASKFDGADISNFFFGVRDIFKQTSKMPKNEKVKEKIDLINLIYNKSANFKRGNPNLKLYYVSTGKWQSDHHLTIKIDAETELLKNLNIFKDVVFTPVDATSLQKLYNHAKNSISKTIDFENKVTIPEIKGIKEAYLGILPVTELIKLITDEHETMLRGLFYDNVRDFQGENDVNLEIEKTIQSADKDFFVLLNNGVTIVADSLSKTGNKFSIEGFQVVNGCQTSHVLYNNKDTVTLAMQVPVRIIVSDDDDIKNKIIKATNRQTPVKNEELIALTDFQKSLEQYFVAQPEESRLYYERRSQQYRGSSGIEKMKIVTISSQIRSFSSMFLDESSRATRYYGTLLTSVKNQIFLKNHKPIAYYVSAYANYKLDSMFRRKQIHEKYRPFKYHMLMALRLQLAGKNMPDMSTNKFEKYCEKIQDSLLDNTKTSQSFINVCDLMDKVLKEKKYTPAFAKDDRLTIDIVNAI
jgi:AIPR protein